MMSNQSVTNPFIKILGGIHSIAAVEPALSKVEPQKAAEARVRLVGILKAQELGQPNLTMKEKKALKDLG